MNTHGHESVANAAGLPLLQEAFQQVMDHPRLNAFYMGNWIADLSQLIDPVAAATARDKLKDFVDDITDTVLNGIYYLNNKMFLPLDQYNDYDSVVRRVKPTAVFIRVRRSDSRFS